MLWKTFFPFYFDLFRLFQHFIHQAFIFEVHRLCTFRRMKQELLCRRRNENSFRRFTLWEMKIFFLFFTIKIRLSLVFWYQIPFIILLHFRFYETPSSHNQHNRRWRRASSLLAASLLIITLFRRPRPPMIAGATSAERNNLFRWRHRNFPPLRFVHTHRGLFAVLPFVVVAVVLCVLVPMFLSSSDALRSLRTKDVCWSWWWWCVVVGFLVVCLVIGVTLGVD